MTGKPESIVSELLARHGRLYAEDAGIKLADRPGPLYQLLVLATLLSAPIPAETAVAAARELFAAGYRSPKAMLEASGQPARLAAALVRVSLSQRAASEVTASVRD